MQKMDGNQDKKRTNKWKREFVHVTSCMTADNNENVKFCEKSHTFSCF